MHRGEKAKRATLAAGHHARKAEIAAILLVLILIVVLTCALSGVLFWANSLYVRSLGPANIALRPNLMEWVLFAFFVSFAAAWLAYDPIKNRLIGPPPPSLSVDYILVSADLPRGLRLGVLLATIALGLLAALNVPCHARFADTAFYAQKDFELREREYPYTEGTAVIMPRYYLPGSRD